MMYQLLNHPEFAKVDLDNVESSRSGSSQMRSELREKFEYRANSVPFLTEGNSILHLGELYLTEKPPQATVSLTAYVSAFHNEILNA
jgi:hypothetical protein